jgi:hypothetical protein
MPIMFRCVTTFGRSASMAILGFGKPRRPDSQKLARRFGALLVEAHQKFPPPQS